MKRVPVDILLVEDSPSDAMLCRAALAEAGVVCRLHGVENGEQVLAFLRRTDGYADVPRPDLILLDLNMPVMGGHAVLREIKADPAFLRIPVVVLTTSEAPGDLETAYGLHANAYVRKPIEFVDFVKAMHVLTAFWLQVATLPSAIDQEKFA